MGYALAWLVYLCGVALVLFCLWRFCRAWRSPLLRRSLLLLAAVLLLVPARADLQQNLLAPALFVALFEFGMSADPAAGRVALERLGYALSGLLALAGAAWLWRRLRRRA